MLTIASLTATAATFDTPLRELAANAGIFVGAAANYLYLTGTEAECKWENCTADISNYTATLGREFSLTTAENAMKFKGTESVGRGEFNFTKGDALASFASAHKMALRGHNLIWVAHNPEWLAKAAPSMSATELDAVMQEHIAAVGAHYKGKVYSWDVVNEAMVDVPKVHTCQTWDCALKGKAHGAHWPNTGDAVDWTIIGTDYVEKAFKYARAAAGPDVKLFYNEYGIHGDTPKANYTLMLLAHLKEVGAPIDGIGVQMHVDNAVATKTYNATTFAAVLARYAALGLDIHISELNVKPGDPIYSGKQMPAQLEAQAKLYASILSVCRAQPKCRSFETWGFTDRHSSLGTTGIKPPGAFYYDEVYVSKPVRAAVATALGATTGAGRGMAAVVEDE